MGVENRSCTEWWVHPLGSGASYQGRLWAWGTVRDGIGIHGSGREPLQELSPRLAWSPRPDGWHAHPVLRRAVASSSLPVRARPRIDDGPGYLLACIVDAIVEQMRAIALEPREIAILWGTMLLPLLAPSVAITPQAAPAHLVVDVHDEPEYLHTLPFFFLHARLQTLIVIIDQVVTLLLADDWRDLREFLDYAQSDEVPSDDDTVAIEDLLASWLDRFMRRPCQRSARTYWNSGFGYRLCRDILHTVLAGEDVRAMAERWDRLVHVNTRSADDATGPKGHLAHRLREALGTALCFKGRPPHPGGRVVQQLVERVWSNWTDPSFP